LPFLPERKIPSIPVLNNSNTLILIVTSIYAIFCAPFIEELVFRGFIWKIFEEKKINNIIILIITSFLFASFHFEIYRFPFLFVAGFIFGLLRMQTTRIGASIVAHTTNNSIVSILGIVIPLIIPPE